MTSLKGDLRSIMGTPFGGVGHAVLIFSRVTRAAFNSDSVVLQLHDRIEMPEEADGKFQIDGLDPGPIRIELEGGTVHNHGWNIDLPDEGVWSLTDLVDAQVDWSPAVIGRAEAAAREARDHADRAEAGADRVGTAEQVGTWASEASSSASSAASARSAAQTARDDSQSARDAAEGHANRAATSESNAAASETNAKQSEDNAGDYAAVATTAATEAVDAMASVTDIVGAKYATQEYVDSSLTDKADKTEVESARWWKTTSLAANTNFDDVRDPSIRIMLGGTHASAPFNSIGVLEVLPTAYKGIVQRATNWNTLEVWKRQTASGVFKEWVKEPTAKDVDAVQALIPSAEHIQGLIDEALSNIDTSDTATGWTRRVPLAVTTGAGPSEGPGSGRYRMKVKFTAPIIRWRLHISTAYTLGGTPGSESTLWLARVGDHTGGAIMDQVVELMSGSAKVPAGGEWVSSWQTHRLDTESIIDVSFTASGSTRNFLAPAWKLDGASWVQTNRAPLWVWIEAETYAETPTVALIGDSTGAGHGSITPVWDSAAAIAGRKQEFLPVLFASSGDTLSGNVSIDDPNFARWSDYGTYDSVVIQAGSNDINSGKTLAEVQASFTSVAAAAKELGAKVYGATIKPRYPTDPNTEVREAYNDWLKTLPAGIAGILDYSTAVAPDGVILPEDNDDGFHLKSSGHHKLAAAYSFPISRPRVVGLWKS